MQSENCEKFFSAQEVESIVKKRIEGIYKNPKLYSSAQVTDIVKRRLKNIQSENDQLLKDLEKMQCSKCRNKTNSLVKFVKNMVKGR